MVDFFFLISSLAEAQAQHPPGCALDPLSASLCDGNCHSDACAAVGGQVGLMIAALRHCQPRPAAALFSSQAARAWACNTGSSSSSPTALLSTSPALSSCWHASGAVSCQVESSDLRHTRRRCYRASAPARSGGEKKTLQRRVQVTHTGLDASASLGMPRSTQEHAQRPGLRPNSWLRPCPPAKRASWLPARGHSMRTLHPSLPLD